MHALRLANLLWLIVPVNSSELLYKSNRPRLSLVHWLINHAGCWKNTQRIRKSAYKA